MSPISLDTSFSKRSVLVQVFCEIFLASVKSPMQLGTVKYSGRAIKAGFSLAAFWTAVLAAVRLSSRVLRIRMWSMLAFKFLGLGVCYEFCF